MPGIEARSGFLFQDSILLEQIVEHRVAQRRAEIEGFPAPASPMFGVEAPIGNTTSEWDLLWIVEHAGAQRVRLEEVKGGEVKRQDRKALWRRVRRSARAGATIDVVLTVDADNLPEQAPHWRAVVAEAPGVPTPSAEPPRVDSAVKLAEEALYHLVMENDHDAGAPPLQEREARDLLMRFTFNERSRRAVVMRINECLASLQYDLGVDEVRVALAGSIGERAASADQRDHMFTVEEITRPVTVLNTLAAVHPTHARTWRDLRSASAQHVEAARAPAGSQEGLAYQDWRPIQSAIAAALDDHSKTAVAIIGRGGTGKTVVLDRFFSAQTPPENNAVWIDASAVSLDQVGNLSAALDLGTFCAATEGKSLVVCVDALETAVESGIDVNALLAELAVVAGLPGARVVITCRDFTWTSLHEREHGNLWSVVLIDQWPVDLVGQLVKGSARSGSTRDLLEVLRTPLFLAIFMRTFPGNEAIPAGIQSRHGVLSAYWRRRILGTEASALQRRSFLACVAAGEAEGRSWHEESNVHLPWLTSEGVFHSEAGRYRFRHPLLRDFALMLWALDAEGPAEARSLSIVERLQGIKGSLSRFGAWRQVLEAISEPDVSVGHQLYQATDVAQLAPAVSDNPDLVLLLAEILGELDDPRPIDIDGLGSALAHAQFGARLAKFAALGQRFAWLQRLNYLPETADWSQSSNWIDGQFLLEMAKFIEVATRDTTVLPETIQSAARRLREWSRSATLWEPLQGGDGWGWSVLVPIVGLHAPTQQTLDWLSVVVPRTARTEWSILDILPACVAAARVRGIDLAGDTIISIYLSVSGLEWRDGALVESENYKANALTDHHRIETALLGHHQRHGKAPGLLDALPELFVPVALGLVIGDYQEEEEDHQRRLRKALAAVAAANVESLPDPHERPEIAELEEELKRRCSSKVTEISALDGLLSDVRWDRYWRGSRVREMILEHLSNRVREDVGSSGGYIRAILWPAVAGSASAVARVLLLDELVRGNAVHRAEVVDQILTDSRIYHCRHVEYFIWAAIKARWPHLSERQRTVVLQNIQGLESSPTQDGIYAIGRLLDAIPAADCPAGLLPYLAIYELHGWSPAPREPDRTGPQVFHGAPDADELYERHLKVPGLSVECDRAWRDVARWPIDKLQQAGPADLETAIATYRALLDHCLPTPASVEQALWTLQRWHALLDFLNKREEESPNFSEREVTTLVAWAFDVAASQAPERVNSDSSSLSVEVGYSADENQVWCEAIGLLDAALVHPTVANDAGLRRRLFAQEIRRMAPSLAPKIARRVLTEVRPYHWFRDDEGRTLLWELLTRPGADPGALAWALRHVRYFRLDQQRGLFRWWLENDNALPRTRAGYEFANKVGQYLGGGTLGRDAAGESLWPRAFVEQYLNTRPSTGVLSTDEGYGEWVIGIVFGAKGVINNEVLPPSAPVDYATLMRWCWRRLKDLPEPDEPDPNRRPAAFALFVFHGILDSPRERSQSRCKIADVRPWWAALEPLACEIMADGSPEDMWHLVFALREPDVIAALGAPAIRGVVRALGDRVKKEPRDLLVRSTSAMASYPEILRYGAEVAKNVAVGMAPSDPLVGEIYAMLESWPAEVRGILEAKRDVRQHGGLGG